MPTIAIIGPYRFSFYSADRSEPPHVHVFRDDDEAKFWLSPVRLKYNDGFSRRELVRIEAIVAEHQKVWLEKWNDYLRH